MLLNLRWGRVEELAAHIDFVDPLICQSPMHLGLDPDCVIREVDGMDVEAERNRGVTQLTDAFKGLKPTSEANLHDSLDERSEVGNHIDIAGAYVCRPIVDVGNRFLDLAQLGFET